MSITIDRTWTADWLRWVPTRVHAALDAWAQRSAKARAQARRLRGARPTAPLPPVMTGRAYLPHPWRD